ncbi:hypothetical protein ACFL42_05125 [Candidatus Omnitrophota bacterium]
MEAKILKRSDPETSGRYQIAKAGEEPDEFTLLDIKRGRTNGSGIMVARHEGRHVATALYTGTTEELSIIRSAIEMNKITLERFVDLSEIEPDVLAAAILPPIAVPPGPPIITSTGLAAPEKRDGMEDPATVMRKLIGMHKEAGRLEMVYASVVDIDLVVNPPAQAAGKYTMKENTGFQETLSIAGDNPDNLKVVVMFDSSDPASEAKKAAVQEATGIGDNAFVDIAKAEDDGLTLTAYITQDLNGRDYRFTVEPGNLSIAMADSDRNRALMQRQLAEFAGKLDKKFDIKKELGSYLFVSGELAGERSSYYNFMNILTRLMHDRNQFVALGFSRDSMPSTIRGLLEHLKNILRWTAIAAVNMNDDFKNRMEELRSIATAM